MHYYIEIKIKHNKATQRRQHEFQPKQECQPVPTESIVSPSQCFQLKSAQFRNTLQQTNQVVLVMNFVVLSCLFISNENVDI